MALADFGPDSESKAGEKNGPERVKCGHDRAAWPAGEVRRFSQEPPAARGNRRDQARKRSFAEGKKPQPRTVEVSLLVVESPPVSNRVCIGIAEACALVRNTAES